MSHGLIMSWKQKIIAEQYAGNSQQFETDFNEAVMEGRAEAIQWNDLLVHATTLPHLKEIGRNFIEDNLGYLPPNDVLIPLEPYLRGLIEMYRQGAIGDDEFKRQALDHLKLIRNADMKHNTCLTYDAAVYQHYNQSFPLYGYAVRERMSEFLGYIPPLEHSIIAELWLRDILADDTYQMPKAMTPDDVRAMTLVKYREVLLSDGQAQADLSPILGDMLIMPD